MKPTTKNDVLRFVLVGLFSAVVSSLFVSVTLMAVFMIENEHGQMGIAYTFLAIIYVVFGAPLNAIVAGVASLSRKSMETTPFLLAFLGSIVVLLCTDPFACHFRKIRYPDVISSNVHTYYPLLVIVAIFCAPFIGFYFRRKDSS